jgi:O-antigen/teichoic acid export membrane protein
MSQLKEKFSKFLHENPIFSRFLKNSGYMFSSSTISVGLVAVQSILAASLLGKSQLGLITLAISSVTTINQLFSFRMGEFVIRFFTKAKEENGLPNAIAVIKASILVESITSVLAFIFLILIAPVAAPLFAKDFDPALLTPLIQLFGIAILANLFTETSNGVLRVTNHFKTQAAIGLIQSIITFSIITLAFIFKWSLLVVLLAYLVGKIFVGVSPMLMALRVMVSEFGRDWWKTKISILTSAKEMTQFVVSTNLSGSIKQLSNESEPLWIGLFIDEAAVGLYRIAMSVANFLTIPVTPFIQTAFPEITRSVVSKKWAQLRKLLRQITLVASAWTIPALLFLAIFGKWILTNIYTPKFEYTAAYIPMVILLVGYAFTNVFFWNRSLLLSFGKANIPLIVLTIGGILKMALAFVVIPAFGINGEAALLSGYFILSTGVMIIIGYAVIRKHEQTEPEIEVA